MKRRSTAGFGLIQVMIGIAVLGVVSLTFARKSFNRQDLGITLQLISYRDQVLDYYTSLASNRLSWKETRGGNWSGVVDGSTVTLKDVDGLRRIPSGGLELSWEEHITSGKILPTTMRTCVPDTTTKYTRENHFCLKAKKIALDQLQISIDYRKKDHTPAQMANYVVKPRSRSITFWQLSDGGLTVGKVCEGKAIAGLNLENKEVTCSGYNLINPKPQCESVGGQRAVTGFSTGRPEDLAQTNCSAADNILLVKSSLPSSPPGAGVSQIHRGVVTPITGYIAVQPHTCPSGRATQGWDQNGSHIGCVRVYKGPDGHRGPRGFQGDRGPRGPRQTERGDDGDQGDPGPPGPKGDPGGVGPTGDSVYCCERC